jgi:hypothetical protein
LEAASRDVAKVPQQRQIEPDVLPPPAPRPVANLASLNGNRPDPGLDRALRTMPPPVNAVAQDRFQRFS